MGAQPLHETLGEYGVQDAEARGGAHVHADGVRADPAQFPQLGTDFLQGLLPGDPLEGVTHTFEGVAQPVGGVIHPVLMQALHAGETQGPVVALVGGDGYYLIVLHLGNQPAAGLADTAERVLGLSLWHAPVQRCLVFRPR